TSEVSDQFDRATSHGDPPSGAACLRHISDLRPDTEDPLVITRAKESLCVSRMLPLVERFSGHVGDGGWAVEDAMHLLSLRSVGELASVGEFASVHR
ncbi:MAG TPA: hypothetical protein VKP30_26975, partial [Polyangiaceae bacterium]|nr:hypothetical protein [Polyangiaceae bacterium]